MLFNSPPKLYLLIHEDDSLTRFIELLEQCPKNIDLYVEVEGNWKYLHANRGIKQIKNHIEHLNIFFLLRDEIAKKMLKEFDLPLCESIPQDVQDFYEEVLPEKKFEENKIGEAFRSKNYEIIEILRVNSEEKIENVKTQIQQLPIKSKILFGVFGLFSLVFFVFLLSFIMPSATIELVAVKKNIASVVNMNFIKTENTLLEKQEDKGNNIHLYPIEIRFEDRLEFPVLSKIFEGQNSEGELTLYNSFAEDITLRDGTRLQTDEGLIFFTKHYIKIPARSEALDEEGKKILKTGTAQVRVVAAEKDIYQEVIGSRGNIEMQKLNIPGLTSYMQKFVWGENKEAFKGGVTRWRREIQQEDLDAAQDKINSVLYAKATKKLLSFIHEQSALQEQDIILFDVEKYIKNEISNITFPENIEGASLEYFPVKGEMLISAYVYYDDVFYKFLENQIYKKRDPKMKIEKMQFDSMTFRYFKETSQEIRISVDLQGRQSYVIDKESEAGKAFQKEIQNTVRGMSIADAKALLYNRPEIRELKISVWPPFKKRFPLIVDNIHIEEE
jgi:hypothetical protein